MAFSPFEVLCITTTVLLAVLGVAVGGSARRGVVSNRYLLGVLVLNVLLMLRAVAMLRGWFVPRAAPTLYFASLAGFFALPVGVYLYLRGLLAAPNAASATWRHALVPLGGALLAAGPYLLRRMENPGAALWAPNNAVLFLAGTNAVVLGYAVAGVRLFRRTRTSTPRPWPLGIAVLFGAHWLFSTSAGLVDLLAGAPTVVRGLQASSIGLLLVFSAVAALYGLRHHPYLLPPHVPYAASPRSEAELHALARRIEEHLRETRAYLDPVLTADALAERLGVPVRHLSQAMSTVLGTHFATTLNRFRVEEAQRLLTDPTRQDDTILTLLYEAGFNSKSAFNRVFRDRTGQTPSAYRKAMQQAAGDGSTTEARIGTAGP